MTPMIIDGCTYTKEYVEGLKQPLLAIRDILIQQGKYSYAASLSEIHAVLDYYCKQVEV